MLDVICPSINKLKSVPLVENDAISYVSLAENSAILSLC
jgi:hypothetical protein